MRLHTFSIAQVAPPHMRRARSVAAGVIVLALSSVAAADPGTEGSTTFRIVRSVISAGGDRFAATPSLGGPWTLRGSIGQFAATAAPLTGGPFSITSGYWAPAAPIACPADINADGTIAPGDIFDYLSLYFSSDSRAEFNGQPGITVGDLFAFLEAYFAGC